MVWGFLSHFFSETEAKKSFRTVYKNELCFLGMDQLYYSNFVNEIVGVH